jgi:alpha-beta hydrolase superfamily lysophospholipase
MLNIRKIFLRNFFRRSRWLSYLAIAGVSVYSTVCIGLWFKQSQLVFLPTREIKNTPAEFNVKYGDVLIPVKLADGRVENIHSWWLPNPSQEQLPIGDRRVKLYLHGNGKNVGANAKHASRLMRMGFSVLLIDYRGYGKSEGDFPSEAAVYVDAQTAWDYLRQQGYQPQQIMIYGHSLGGAIAINLAVNNPDAFGVIVDASFTSIKEMAELDGKYRLLPLDLLIHQRFDSINKVRSLKPPVLYIHGTKDELIPAAMSQRLYDETLSRKKLVLIENAMHNNTAATNEELYRSSILDFFNIK